MCDSSTKGAIVAHMQRAFPNSQHQLLLAARGERSQAEFARVLGVNRSSLSRYENEVLGAPVAVINYCLSVIARDRARPPDSQVELALDLVRSAAAALERIPVADR